jgi:hypothetical protein
MHSESPHSDIQEGYSDTDPEHRKQSNLHFVGCALDRVVSRRFPSRRPGFDPRSGNVEFVVDQVALPGQVFI